MKLSLKLNKTLDENAQIYFTKAKKLRKKIPGANKAIGITNNKIAKLEDKPIEKLKQVVKIKRVKRKWFEKFRWFLTSEGFFVIAGRDSSTNEDLIKKHTDKEDLVLHSDMAGSPFVVIKKNSCEKEISEKDISECADFVLAYSRAWKKGFGNADIFYVKPEQVTKTANAGEHLGKGAFMIRGKTNYIQNKLDFCVGVYDKIEDFEYSGRIFVGPEEAAKVYCKKYFNLIPGRQKTSEIAKILKYEFASELDLDEFIRVIPAASEIVKK
jgi:predicted ribosome quality control (RQC) complex YloA/Tae2 family protein